MSQFGACSARISGDRQTDRTTTVTIAEHAHQGLIIIIMQVVTKQQTTFDMPLALNFIVDACSSIM